MLWVVLLAVVIEVAIDFLAIYKIWWAFGVCLALEILLLAYLALGFVVIKKALYVKKRSYDEVLFQDKKFHIPEEVSILPYERVTTKGSDGYEMVASFMRARGEVSHKYFIICHGYNSNRVTCNKYANVLLDLGYNTLCPDMRRCGETGGVGITFGIKESEDITLWIDYIKAMDSEAEISLYGISLGAASCVMVTSQRDDIKSLISYCSYASLKDIIIDRMLHSHVPKFLAYLLYPIVENYVYTRFGAKKVNTNIMECISRVKCPTIIIHSNGDRFTNIRHAYMLHKAKPDAVFVEFDNAPHARSYGVYPEEYKSVLREFIRHVETGEPMEDKHFTGGSVDVAMNGDKSDDNVTL